MKTLEQVNKQIESILNIKDMSNKKHLPMLQDMKIYLESNPSEEFIKNELIRIKKLKDSTEGHISQRLETLTNPDGTKLDSSDPIYKKRKHEYEKELHLSRIKKQYKALVFLLSK